MKNNKIGAVSVESLGRKKERHSFTHDVNTTCSFTDVHPLQCVLLPAKTKSVVKTESLIRLDPIVAPTFGRLEYKTWHYFVNMTDLSRNFAQLLTQKRVARGNGVEFMPKKVPNLPLCLISSLVLMESHCTIWRAVSYVGAKSHKWELLSSRANLGAYDYLFGFNTDDTARVFVSQDALTRLDGYKGWGLNLRRILPDSIFKWASDGTAISSGLPFTVWLNNPSVNDDKSSFFDWRDNSDNVVTNYGGIDVAPVQLESADYVICKSFLHEVDGQTVTSKYAFAFRLSDFGKRLRKILLGLGYQIDFTNTKSKSLMPLFAFFKAYYSTFGILTYMNWEDTAAAKLLSIYDNTNTYNFISGFAPIDFEGQSQWRSDIEGQIRSLWFQFIQDLSFAYTTDAQDWVSSHTRSFAVAERADGSGAGNYFDNSYRGVDNQSGLSIASNVSQAPQLDGNGNPITASVTANNHAFIDHVLHGQLDSEVLKTLYLQTNLQTIAGQRVAELLKLKGLGDWMDSQNVRFIGQHTVNLNIKDVTTTSDTLKTAADGVTVESGASVGSWGANGLGYGKSKTFKYENDEVGFWVTLCAVVPSSGYCQAVLPSLDCIDATSFYDPAFDGMGYEATAKEKICGALDWADMTQLQFNGGKGYLENTFGYTPRESGLKVHPNVANGDFSLRSLRTQLLPYFFDKFFELGERDFANHATTGTGSSLKTTVDDIEVFEPSELPIAGDLWRFTARFDWLGKLSRIFAIAGDPYGAYNVDRIVGWLDNIDFRQFVPYFRESVDGFKCQNIITFTAYAPMLQIADSYETLKDGNEGHVSERIGKA